MKKRVIQYLLWGIIYWLFPLLSFGQERQNLSYPRPWRPEDTSAIILLVNQGIPLSRSNLDSALSLFREAERRSRATYFQDGIGFALSFIGLVLTQQGHYEEGLASYREALPYCLRARYIKTSLPCLYINRGVSSVDNGKATYFYYKALEYLSEHLPGDKNIIVVYSNLAVVQARMGNYRKALNYAHQAEQLSAQSNLAIGQVPALINMGNMYTVLKMEDSALYCLRKGLDIARAKGYTDMQQSLLASMGEVSMQRGLLKEAIAYFQQALDLSQSTNRLYGSILPEYSLAIALFRSKEYRRAEALLRAALSKATQAGLMENRHVAHKALATIYEATGRYKEALQEFGIYEQLKDSLSGLEKALAINELEARYQSGQKDRMIAEKELKLSKQQRVLERNRVMAVSLLIFIVLILVILLLIYRNRRKIRKRNMEMAQLKAVMSGEEMERSRIARELHDGIGGMLTGLRLDLSALLEPKELAKGDLNSLVARVGNISDEVQKAARNLTPDILQQHSLWQAIVHYCEQFEGNEGLHIDLNFMADTDDLDKSVELTLYRVVQELVQNSARHAFAQNVEIQLRREAQMLYLSVEDDGIGFDTTKAKPGLGLHHIRARIATLNGYCSLTSTPGEGTIAYIELDMNKIPG